MPTDSEGVPWRDFEKLEKVVEKLADTTHALQLENAEFKVLISGMSGKLDSMEKKIDLIATATTNNKITIAKVMVVATLSMSIISYAINKWIFVK